MVDRLPSDEAQRKRSTEIVQSVPITVSGVDALGQAFKERTATLSITCHGCKFESKHYVLKESWVELEVPRAEPGGPPRQVRAQVSWIQKPKTVRELFQIVVDLEIPGNIWGIAFPPDDWFPYPEESGPTLPAPPARKTPGALVPPAPGPAPAPPAARTPAPPAAPPEEKLRVVPRPGEAEMLLAAVAHQVDRLVAGARAQIETVVRETSAAIAREEMHRLLGDLTAQAQQAAGRAVAGAAQQALSHAVEKALQEISDTRRTAAESLQAELKGAVESGLGEARRHLAERLEEVAGPARENLRSQIEAEVNRVSGRMDDLAQQVTRLDNALGTHLGEAQSRLASLQNLWASVTEITPAGESPRFAELREAATRLHDEIEASLRASFEQSRARFTELRGEMDAALEAVRGKAQAEIREFTENAERLRRRVGESFQGTFDQAQARLTEVQGGVQAASEAARSAVEAEQRVLAEAAEQLRRESAQAIARTQDSFRAAVAESKARLADTTERLRRERDQVITGAQESFRTASEQARSGLAEMRGQLAAAGDALSRLREETAAVVQRAQAEWRAKLDQASEAARAAEESHRQALAETAGKFRGEVSQSLEQARAQWRENLESDMAVAGMGWNTMLQEAVASGAQNLNERAARVSAETITRAEAELQARAGAVARDFEQHAAALTDSVAVLRAGLEKDLERGRAALEEIDRGVARVEEHAARVDAIQQGALQALEQRGAALAGRHAAELEQRAEAVAARTLEMLQPALEATGHRFLAQLNAQAEGLLAPHLTRAADAAGQLHSAGQRAEEALRAHQERLRAAGEDHLRATSSALAESTALLRQEFVEANRAEMGRWLGELDEKATDVTQTTFESLYKSAEWYQKKAQTSMQSTLDKLVAESAGRLREQAAEVSRLCAAELDHHSRSFVEHARALLEDAGREREEKTRHELDTLRETRAAAFGDDAHRLAADTLKRLDSRTQSLTEQAAAEFRERVASEIQRGFADARTQMEASLPPLLESWRAARDAQEKQWRDGLVLASDDSVEEYKRRLQNASNAWMAASVATLNAHTQNAMQGLSRSAEDRLREAFSLALAGLAETMRQRLLGLSAELRALPSKESGPSPSTD